MAWYLDFGLFDKPYLDEQRVEQIKKTIKEDFDEQNQEIKNMRVNARPITPDSFPIVGRLKKYPNVIINNGHGPHGY